MCDSECTRSAPLARKSHSEEWRFRAKLLVRKEVFESPQGEPHKIGNLVTCILFLVSCIWLEGWLETSPPDFS